MAFRGIRAIGLTKSFEKKKEKGLPSPESKKSVPKGILAVDDVNLDIPKGMLFGLLGPNGAGKTTTIRLLSTLLLPDQGTAIVNGYDVVRQPNQVRSSIGVVTGGERGLYWRLTGRENLQFFARLYGLRENESRTRIEELLRLVELQDRADDTVEKYSRGMKQRLHLIKGLVHDPPVLLLDEPTLGFDPNSAVVIRDFIKEKLQKEQGKTILLTTHYMEEADQLCDRIAIIDQGKIVSQGSPEELKQGVRKIAIIRVSASNVAESLISQLKNLLGVREVELTVVDPVIGLADIVIHTESAEETLPEFTETLVKAGARIRLIEQQMPSLEDVFISLTGRRLRD